MAVYRSTWFADQILGWFRGTSMTAASNLYLALFITDPLPDGSGAEVSGGSYARVAIPCNGTNWSTISDSGASRVISNLLAKSFPTPSADWGTPGFWALLTASSGGNLVVYGDLSALRPIVNGDQAPQASASMLVVGL